MALFFVTVSEKPAPLGLLGQLPISDPLELLVSDLRGQLRNRVDAEVATVRHDCGQLGADILGRWLFALGEREEIASKAN